MVVTKSGVKLLDFGLAKRKGATTLDDRTVTKGLTTEGAILGTLHYMSPEQLQGRFIVTAGGQRLLVTSAEPARMRERFRSSSL